MSIDTTILNAIKLCLKPQNQTEIEQGQEILEAELKKPQYLQKLMMIGDNNQIEIDYRQFAVANIKTNIKKYWKKPKIQNSEKPYFSFSDEDKQVIRSNLLDAQIRSASNSKLSKLYSKIIQDVCSYDFPEEWPNLIGQTLQKFSNSSNEQEIYGCLLTFQQVFQTLQFETVEKRQTLDQIIPNVFSLYQALIQKLMQIYNPDNAYLLKPILKSFYMCISLDLPQFMQSQLELLGQWFIFFKLLLDSEVPQQLSEYTKDEEVINKRDKHPLWKNKKWAGRIIVRIESRYSNLDKVEQNLQQLSQWLNTNYIPLFLDSFLNQLILSQTQFVGTSCIHFAMKYLLKCMKVKHLFQKIQPHTENIIYNCLLPLFLPTPKDIGLLDSDPQEYIRQEDDFIGCVNFKNNKMIAIDFLLQLLKNEFSDQTIFEQFFQYCSQYIETGYNPKNATQALTLEVKDSILFIFVYLREIVINNRISKNQIESFLEKNVFPDLISSSQHGLIRARCCQLIGKYGNLSFKNPQNIINAVTGITQNMKDSNLVIRFKSSLALNTIIQQKEAHQLIKNHLQQVLQIYLKIIEEIDSEELVSALEGIVEEYQDCISPYAYELCLNLASNFQKLKEKNNDENDEGESGLAAGQCLATIAKIIQSQIPQELLKNIMVLILPLINNCLTDDYCDYIDESFHLLQQLVFRSNQIEQNSVLWFYYPILIYIVMGNETADIKQFESIIPKEQYQLLSNSLTGWGEEYLAEIVIILKNFIQKGGNFFITTADFFNVNFVELIFKLVQSIYSNFTPSDEDQDEEDEQQIDSMKNVVSLLYCLIENNVAHQTISGNILMNIIKITLQNLDIKNLPIEVQVANFDTISLCFFYNVSETLVIINGYGPNVLQQLFQKWFSIIKHFKSEFSKQRLLLSFTCLLGHSSLYPEQLGQLGTKLIKESTNLVNKIMETRYNDDISDGDSDCDQNNINNIANKLGNHMDKLEKIKEKNTQDEENEPESEDEDFDFDTSDRFLYNYNYNSPLDLFDEILFLEQQMIKISQQNPQYKATLLSALSENEKLKLEENIKQAKEDNEDYLKTKQ